MEIVCRTSYKGANPQGKSRVRQMDDDNEH